MDLKVPAVVSYADKHQISQLLQSLLSGLLIDQPDDPIGHMIKQLRRSRSDGECRTQRHHQVAPWLHTASEGARVLLLGPPAVGKSTVAKRLSAELRAVHVTPQSFLRDQSERSTQVPDELQVELIQQRLTQADCFDQGWVLEGIPQTGLQARSLQQAGVLPEHVVMMEAPDDVLLERAQGRLVDPATGDTYHRTFIWPTDGAVVQRLEEESGVSEEQRMADLQRYRCEVTGLTSAYQNILKVINCDQPPTDVYQQVLGFVRIRRQYRTPRILLLAPPGAGKSHQAKLLSEKYKMVEVGCDHLLKSAAADGSALGRQVRLHLDNGRTGSGKQTDGRTHLDSPDHMT